jgi:uncharacterized membrane protein
MSRESIPVRPANSGKTSRLTLTIQGLAAAGVAVSALSLYHHWGTSATASCDFGARFNCDLVNRSIYSTFLGIPVGLIGLLGYASLLALARPNRTRSWELLLASSAGLAFAIYLTYIEAFLLAVWCVLCLSSLGLILLITTLSAWVLVASRSAMRRN